MTEIHTLLHESLEKRWDKYRAELKRARAEFSEESVHDLRVATRRILALFDMLRMMNPSPGLQKLRRSFKSQLDGFDDLRDTQVMLAEISERIAVLPGLREFQAHLQKREKKLLKAAGRLVKELDTKEDAQRMKALRRSLAETPTEPLAVLDETYRVVLQRFSEIDPTASASIHRVRVVFKKFRYMLEIIFPTLPGFPQENLAEMHAYQTHMGEIQDVEVFLHALDDFEAADLRQFYEDRHAEVIRAYLEDMGQIHRFWRAAPDQAFPWEKTA